MAETIYENTEEIEYGSDEYFEAIQDDHDLEAGMLEDEGWHILDCSRPFYLHPFQEIEGEIRTICCTATSSPTAGGFDWYWKKGDCFPPSGTMSVSKMIVEGGEWVRL